MVTNYVVGRIYDVEWTRSSAMFAGLGAHYIEFEPVDANSFIDTNVYDVVNHVEYDFRATNIIFSVNDNGDVFTIIVIDEDNVSHTYTSDDFDVKFKNGQCIHNEFSNLTSDPLYIELLDDGVEHFCLYLYNLTGEKIIVDKSSYLTNSKLLNGQLTDECDLLNPSILIDYDGVFSWNYCFIPSFNRFYFINKIVSVRKGLWRIDLHVDVLYSFESDLRSQECFIARNEDITINDSLFDKRIPREDALSVKYVYINTPLDIEDNHKNITFDYSDIGDSGVYKCSFVALSTKYFHITSVTGISAPAYTDLPDIPNTFETSKQLYLCDLDTFFVIKGANLKDDVTAEYLTSMLLLPCDLSILYGKTSAPADDVYAGEKLLTLNGWEDDASVYTKKLAKYTAKSNSPYLCIEDWVCNDIQPIAHSSYGLPESVNIDGVQYELYLPFVGYIDVKYHDVFGKRLQIYYSIDFESGEGNCILYNYEDDKVIYSSQCKIGIEVPINTTNNLEVTKQKQNNLLNLGVNTISAMIGMITGNPLVAVGSAVGVGKSIVQTINQNNLLFTRANVSIGGEVHSLYFPVTQPHWKITYHNVIQTSFDEFYKLNGAVANIYGALTSVTGYTEIPNMHYEPSTQPFITSPEIDEIVSLAKDGIIL